MSGIDVPVTVNNFIAVCRDGQKSYEEAANRVEEQELAHLFQRMAKAREEVVARLAPHVEMRDEEVTDSGTIAGATHRFLTQVQAVVSSDESKTLVSQLAEMEKLSLAQLRKIAEEPLPDPLRQVVIDSIQVFEATQGQMEALRTATP